MSVRNCPHCQNPIEVVDGSTGAVGASACASACRFDQERTRTVVSELQRLSRFELLEQVGAGAFGIVWTARGAELGRLVAVKIPHAGKLVSRQETERFLREGRSTAQLRHPGIVSVHEV